MGDAFIDRPAASLVDRITVDLIRRGFPCRASLACGDVALTRSECVAHERDLHHYVHREVGTN